MSAYIPPGSQPPQRPEARAPSPDTAPPAPPDLDDEDEDAACEVVVTFFTDHTAGTKREERLSLTTLAGRIHTTAASDKANLPWLKLARFGDQRTEKGSLRHNANLVVITGVEGYYDLGEISLADAKDIIARAGITAIIYPSPSYTPNLPKWRVLCPFSERIDVKRRYQMVKRLNGVFAGALSDESFTASQSYYFGHVEGTDAFRLETIS